MQIVFVKFEEFRRRYAGGVVERVASDTLPPAPRHEVHFADELYFRVWCTDKPRTAVVVPGVAEFDAGVLAQADIIVPAFEGWTTVSLMADGNW